MLHDHIAADLESLVQLFPVFYKTIIKKRKDDHPELCTHAQFRTLRKMKEKPYWRMSDLSRSLHVSNGSLTIMINRLIEENLVKRGRSADDRRVVTVELTPAGLDYLEQQHQLRQNAISQQISRLSEDEQKSFSAAILTCKEFISRILQEE